MTKRFEVIDTRRVDGRVRVERAKTCGHVLCVLPKDHASAEHMRQDGTWFPS